MQSPNIRNEQSSSSSSNADLLTKRFQKILEEPENYEAMQRLINDLHRAHDDACKAGRYDEAELADSRLQQLWIHEQNRRKEEERSEQIAQRLAVEEAHMLELSEFNEIWDAKVEEFENHAEVLQQTLHGRQQQELQAFMRKHEEDADASKMKESKQLLNLRFVEAKHVKLKNYEGATTTRRAVEMMYCQELDMFQTKTQNRLNTLEEKLVTRQELEMKGLLKRIKSGREEQRQARKVELQRLLQRYHNVKSQLESQQSITRLKLEKSPNKNSFGTPMKKLGSQVKSSGYGQRNNSQQSRRISN